MIHPHRSAEEFARLDEAGRLPEGALLAACDEHGAPYGMLAAGTRMRLLRAAGDDGGAATRYLELDAAKLESEDRPLLGLLAPAYLAEGGFDDVLARSARLRRQSCACDLDRALREGVLPGPRSGAGPLGRARRPRHRGRRRAGGAGGRGPDLRLPRSLPALRRERRLPADGQPHLRPAQP